MQCIGGGIIRIMGHEGLLVAEFSPHNSAINSRFQNQIWPIFANHAIKDPAHLGYSPHTRR